MNRRFRWLVIVLAWIGAATILFAVGSGLLILVSNHAMERTCRDSEQRVLKSPDGKRAIKAFHQDCGASSSYSVYLSTGFTGFGTPHYISVAEIDDVGPGKVSVNWNGPSEVDITYPKSAKVGDVAAKMFGVRIVLNPPL